MRCADVDLFSGDSGRECEVCGVMEDEEEDDEADVVVLFCCRSK